MQNMVAKIMIDANTDSPNAFVWLGTQKNPTSLRGMQAMNSK